MQDSHNKSYRYDTKEEPAEEGKEIEEHLGNVNMDPWFYIYENFIKNGSEEKSDQAEDFDE